MKTLKQLITVVIFFLFLSSCAGQSLKIKSYAPTPERGVELRGRVIKPSGDGPFPGVIILHGCAGQTNNDIEWAYRLKKWGYASYLLDSFGGRGVANVCKSRKVTKLTRAIDAHAAKVQFGSLPFVDRNRIGLLGYSHGGGAVLNAIDFTLMKRSLPEEARDPFKAVVALYPYCHYSVNANTNTMILIGEKDDWTPSVLCDMNRPKAHFPDSEIVVKIYPGAYHKFDDSSKMTPKYYSGHCLKYSVSAMKDAVPRVKSFFDKHLN